MRRPGTIVAVALAVNAAVVGCASRQAADGSAAAPVAPSARPAVHLAPLPGERHLRDIRQLTFGGENAEAYFSFDGERLVFQAREKYDECDQEYVMNQDGTDRRLVSTGRGVVTCGYFFPDASRIVYASTHESMASAFLGGESAVHSPMSAFVFSMNLVQVRDVRPAWSRLCGGSRLSAARVSWASRTRRSCCFSIRAVVPVPRPL